MTEWKDVSGYEGLYKVSSDGQVVSVKNGRFRLLKPNRAKRYLVVSLYKNDVITRVGVHRLVAQAFCENVHSKPQVNHIDGDGANNNATNLEWVTGSENCLHSHRVLNRKEVVGEQHGRSKLTEDEVRWIRAWQYSGFSCAEVAREFGVSDGAVWLIWQRRSWKHVA